jgi:hypothetical protein
MLGLPASRFFVLAALAAGVSLGCGPSQAGSTTSSPGGAAADGPFQILALEPYRTGNEPAGGASFHGFTILAQADVADPAARERILSIVQGGIDEGGTQAKCFNPRHGVHATKGGRGVDYVICYECSAVNIVEDGREPETVTTSNVQAKLDAAFAAAGLKQP